tara:strand:- start:425 stop:571 length:147 start_codon:yes stop_codon:yes gene_type:complete
MIVILFLTLIAAAAYFNKECRLTKKEKKELQEWRDKFTNKYQDDAEKL